MVIFFAVLAGLVLHMYNFGFIKVLGGDFSVGNYAKVIFLFTPFTLIHVGLYTYYYSYFSVKVPYTTLFIIAVGVSVLTGYIFDYFVNGGRILKITEIVGLVSIMGGVWLTLQK